ncbi:unnamed protein product [Mytilus edulis]|uniref:Uncharacterized protein n=1 Tax=Mytilus edulis TaxID=6550 RepID=A0A8S3S407_MYTED|nr:unnamed protein product [Mytilus edulis]
MKSVSAKLSQTDFTQIMKTWNEKFAKVLVPLSKVSETTKKEQKDKKENELPDEQPPLSQQSNANVACKLKFDFKIESLSVTLYVGDNNLMAKRDDKAALSKMNLKVIVGTVRQMSDKSIKAECKLEDMVLDDCRYYTNDQGNRITRMIQKHDKSMSAKYEDTPSTLIDVSATHTCSKNSSVARKNKQLVYMCLSGLPKVLKSFVTKGMPQKERTDDSGEEENKDKFPNW